MNYCRRVSYTHEHDQHFRDKHQFIKTFEIAMNKLILILFLVIRSDESGQGGTCPKIEPVQLVWLNIRLLVIYMARKLPLSFRRTITLSGANREIHNRSQVGQVHFISLQIGVCMLCSHIISVCNDMLE